MSGKRPSTLGVIAGLDPAIQLHVPPHIRSKLDARVKPAHDTA